MNNVFKFFAENPELDAAHTSLAFSDPSAVPNHIFRGSINEFIVKNEELNGIHRIEVCGTKLSDGVYDSSLKIQPEQLVEFMDLINKKGIKELSFTGCKLNPDSGVIIGNALGTNKSLERLEVTSNHLLRKGMLAILTGLVNNRSLKSIFAGSYNFECYHWSIQELNLLAQVISVNSVLKDIILSDNQLNDFSDIAILSGPYHSITHRELANISGLVVSRSVSLPDFCMKNLDELDEKSRYRFINN